MFELMTQGLFELFRTRLLSLCCALLPTLVHAQTSLPQLIATVLATHPAVQGQRAQRNTLLHAQV